jgi:hypothetical protein
LEAELETAVNKNSLAVAFDFELVLVAFPFASLRKGMLSKEDKALANF